MIPASDIVHMGNGSDKLFNIKPMGNGSSQWDDRLYYFDVFWYLCVIYLLIWIDTLIVCDWSTLNWDWLD